MVFVGRREKTGRALVPAQGMEGAGRGITGRNPQREKEGGEKEYGRGEEEGLGVERGRGDGQS